MAGPTDDGDRLRLIVHGDDGPDLDGRLTAFEATCRKRRRVGDTDVWWAEGYADPGRELYFRIAYWTRDELVLHVFGRPEDMEMAIRRLG